MQGTVRGFDPVDGSGSVFLDDGSVCQFGPDVFAASGLRLLRRGQRVAIRRGPSGAITALTLATFPLPADTIMFMPTDRSLETLAAEDFRGHQGTRFRLTPQPSEGGSAVSVDAELAEVSEHPAGAMGSFRTPFSLVFHGPLQPVLPQGLYRVEHDQFGSVELFLVPIGPNEVPPGQTPTAMRYEAVFG
jgi:2-phospho-L-lactate guanylyltransferase